MTVTQVTLENVDVVYPLFGREAARGAKKLKAGAAETATVGADIVRDGAGVGVLALSDISVDLRGGDRLAVIGHNGCGKSTLLRVMAGIFEPRRGRVRIEGEVSALFNVGIGVKQDATGYRNIILNGLMKGLSRAQAEALAPEIVDFSELGDYVNYPVSTYSRGMALRLSFAMATAMNPKILLLDEWMGAGDQAFRDKAQARMRGLVEGAGIVVLASHRIPLLRDVCDKCLWLEKGRVRDYGDVAELTAAFQREVRRGATGGAT